MDVQEALDAINAAIVPPFRSLQGGSHLPEWMIPTNGEIDETDPDKYTIVQLAPDDTEESILFVHNNYEAKWDKICLIDEFLAYINAYKIWSTGDDSQTAPHFDEYCEELSFD